MPGSSMRPRSRLVSDAIREVSLSSGHGTASPRCKTSVIQKAKSSPETNQRGKERSSSRLIRRKGSSANLAGTDDSDLPAIQSVGDAGLVRPPADMPNEGTGGLNLAQAISLLKAERDAYIDLQNLAFTDIAGLRVHLHEGEQQCSRSAERIQELAR